MTAPQRLSGLSPEQLDRLARDHLDAMFAELRAAGGELRESCNPVSLAVRHPFVAAAAAGALAGILLGKARRPSASPSPEHAVPPQPARGGLFRSLASGAADAAARALPAILNWWTTRRHTNTEEH